MSILASILLERPVKWIEDKTGNLISTGSPGTCTWTARCAAPRRQDPRHPHAHDADHGAFFSDAQPSKFKIGLMHSAFAAYESGRASDRARHLHQQGAWRGGVPVLVPGHRGDVLPGEDGPGRGGRPRHGPGGVPADELRERRPVPAPDPVRLPDRLGAVRQVPRRRLKAVGYEIPAAAAGGQGQRQAARPGHLHHDRAARRGQQPRVRHPRHQDVRLRRAQDPHDRQGHRQDGARGQGQGHETTWAQIGRTSSVSRPTTSWWRRATPIPRRSAWAPTLPAARGGRGGDLDGVP